jgi:alkanesulfonate monooxygenase SsuD/methylene tetrahydromethanopterin reductase-like flavin-dependent oxidoreductase (luciferase family)
MPQKEELHQLLNTTTQRPQRDRIGIYIEARDSVDAIARIREAEQAGVQQIWMATESAGRADILTVFAAVASQTERIRLGTGVVPIYPRHPLVTAQQALAIHDIAPGRLRLGVGSSIRFYIEGVYGLQLSSPLQYLREYVEVLRGVLWEGSSNYHGKFFQVAFPATRTASVPLLIPALGLKAFRLAGEIADGVLPAMCPLPYLLNQALPAMRAGAEASKRPVPPLTVPVTIAMSTDEAAVLAAVRQQLKGMTQLGPYANMFVQAGFAGAVKGDEAQLDALARSLTISGDEATVRHRLQELLASGLDELLLGLVPIADEERERKQLFHLIGSL